jgi:cytochrome b561
MENNSNTGLSTQYRYNVVSRCLHWALLALLIVEFSIAWTMPEVEKDTRPVGLIAWHLFFGTLILTVVLLRILWHFTQTTPDSVPMPRWQELTAKITHRLLYIVLVVLPLMGWANASSRGWDVKLFGFIPLPALAPKESDWGHALGDVHQAVAIGLLVLVALHVAAAVYHQWILRDNLLQRMLPPKT